MQQYFNFDKLTMVDAIADYIAIQKGRIHPSAQDEAEARKTFDRWNKARSLAGVRLFDNDHEPPELKIVEIEAEGEE